MVCCLAYQIDRSLCAVLYDEENCDRSGSFLSLMPGQEGELPRLTAGTRYRPHLVIARKDFLKRKMLIQLGMLSTLEAWEMMLTRSD